MAKLGAILISQEIMRKRMASTQNNAPPAAALAVLTYRDSLTLHFNGEEIYIFHPEPAHTDGDSIIYFKHANVMHVGDVPASLRYPNIGVNEGGTVEGMIAGEPAHFPGGEPEIDHIVRRHLLSSLIWSMMKSPSAST